MEGCVVAIGIGYILTGVLGKVLFKFPISLGLVLYSLAVTGIPLLIWGSQPDAGLVNAFLMLLSLVGLAGAALVGVAELLVIQLKEIYRLKKKAKERS
jgi:hypothetical protein